MLENYNDDAYEILDFIKFGILEDDAFFEEKEDIDLRREINSAVLRIEKDLIDVKDTSLERLDSNTRKHFNVLIGKLIELGDKLMKSGFENYSNYVNEAADAITEKMVKKPEVIEPQEEENDDLYDIFISFKDTSGGERLDDPSYKKVRLHDILDCVNRIERQFFDNKLCGSYRFSPVFVYSKDEDDYIGMPTKQFKKIKKQGADYEINKLVISCVPTDGSDDILQVFVNGDGTSSELFPAPRLGPTN